MASDQQARTLIKNLS